MADVGIGLETLTHSETVTSSTTVDMDIPTGKVVLASGIQCPSGFGNAFMSANGPHPSDNTKWRFQASVAQQNGGNGYSTGIECWLIVANAAS